MCDVVCKMDKHTQDIAYFLSFCIEQYKHRKHISGQEAMMRLKEAGVLLYLANNFEILHTQGAQWIMEDIEEFMRLRQSETI